MVREREVADLVQGIGCIGNEFTEKNVLVGVKSVDDKGKQLWCVGFLRALVGLFSIAAD